MVKKGAGRYRYRHFQNQRRRPLQEMLILKVERNRICHYAGTGGVGPMTVASLDAHLCCR